MFCEKRRTIEFQSTPPMREATKHLAKCIRMFAFQSTPPMREAT